MSFVKDGLTYLVKLPSPPESGVSPSHLCDVTWYGLPTSYPNVALPVRISSPLLVHLAIQGLCPLLKLLLVSDGFLSIVCVAFRPYGLNSGIYAAVLFTQGLTNTFGVHLLHYLNNISVWWHAIGTTSLVIAILVKAPSHQSASFVFRQFIDGTGPPGEGWGDRASHVYVVVIGVCHYCILRSNLT